MIVDNVDRRSSQHGNLLMKEGMSLDDIQSLALEIDFAYGAAQNLVPSLQLRT